MEPTERGHITERTHHFGPSTPMCDLVTEVAEPILKTRDEERCLKNRQQGVEGGG